MNMQLLTNNQAYHKILKTKGKIFSVIFVKKDNTVRKMTCRLGVTKHLKGGELKYKPIEYNLLPVFDMEIKQYRMINFNTLKAVKISDQVYVIGDNLDLVSPMETALFA